MSYKNYLKIGKNLKKDTEVMLWLIKNYRDFNIAEKVTYNLTKFVNSIDSKNNPYIDKGKLRNLGKAIRQDFRSLLLSAEKVYEYSKVDRSEQPIWTIDEETNCAKFYYNKDKDITQIHMEHFITKYRVIIEYITNIICDLIYLDRTKYKSLNPDKLDKNGRLVLPKYKEKNLKVDYYEKMIVNKNIVDKKRFETIRHIRNDIIHNGASCMIFDGEELLFQIYNLDVDEIICTDDYLSNGNAISCNYFIATNISYLVYYLDIIFTSLLNDKIAEIDDISYMKKNYIIDQRDKGIEHEKILELLSLNEAFDCVPSYQKSIIELINKYCEIYIN